MNGLTKMLPALTMALTITFGLNAFAGENSPNESAPQQMDAASQAEIHGALCTGPQAEQLKEPEIKEMRDQVVRFLTNPAKTAQELLEEGNRTDVGPFGLLAACAMVMGLEDTLLAKGCIGDDGVKLGAVPALQLCKSLLTQLAK